MISLSNSLSFFRAPLALLFWQENATIRLIAVLLAMITDSIDGYLARRSQSTSRFGAILDPAMDKFFVYFALTAFFLEGKIAALEFLAMLSRDILLALYALSMWTLGRQKWLVIRAIRWGKITTALQFLILTGLIFNISFPWYIFVSFVIMGGLALREFVTTSQRTVAP